MNAIRTIMYKEWADTLRNKLILSMLLGIPLIMTAIPVVMLVIMKTAPVNTSDLEEMSAMLANPLFSGLEAREMIQVGMASNMLVLFLMMPMFVPMTIATYSIVGEKMTRSLEPLLATPISTGQLLIGKSLAAAVPGMLVTWIAYALFLVVARFAAVSDRVFNIFVDPMWLVAMLLLAPLLTILAVNVGIIVSSRVNDPRAAEQLGGLIVIPLVGFMIAVLAGFIFLNVTTFLIAALFIALVDVALIFAGSALFQRETILTRWK